MKALTYEQFRKVLLLVFGLGLAVWEVVIQHGRDPAVMVFLAMMLGFQPAVKLDTLLRKTPAPETPATEPAKEAAS